MSTTTAAPPTLNQQSLARRISSFLFAHPRVRLTLLLTAPMAWLGIVYIVALALLLVTAFWSTDSFTGEIDTTFTLDNVISVFTESLYQTVTLRTVLIALAVTAIDVVIALPIAFFMAKVASARTKRILMILVLMPLWASYLVKVYAWRSVLSENGLLSWLITPFGGETPGYGVTATIIAISYLWLPFVILPIHAGMERVPDSLLEASSDLGGRSWRTIRSVVLPLAVPAIIAGTIFSFALTLGDYITVRIVGGTSQMLGNLIYDNVGAANNLPLAAAIALVPLVIIFIYLFVVRRSGALNNL
ncbi:ABC transporter permease [Streptomyces sp. AC495_CC817]|uniref:ABC transporter permease n=1 Tax=Streptomyces sp. AC495_CC817 TaxID=2823900 RepID=UPI001C25211B|nr:ABC transporter permease [Streptomyces sp. AC495_CC817]